MCVHFTNRGFAQILFLLCKQNPTSSCSGNL